MGVISGVKKNIWGLFLDFLIKTNENRICYKLVKRGNPEDLDKLVYHPDAFIRRKILKHKRDKDFYILVNDESEFVLSKLVAFGRPQDLDKLVYSKYWKIRCAVADFGRDKDLDILVHDDSTIIKITVGEFKRVKDLEILKNDDNDTVRLLALHSLDSLKVGKEVQIKSFDKDGNELSEFSGKLYNVRCPIYNKYLKNKKLLNVYVNDDVKTYYEDSVVIYDDKLKPDYSFMNNEISELSIENMIKNSKKENLFIIRSLSGKILYVFSYNRYNHCFTTVDSKTMHRFFIDDNEIILYNIKYQFANKYEIQEPYELKYHIDFEEYY